MTGFSALVKKKYKDFEQLAPLFPIALWILVCDFFAEWEFFQVYMAA